MRRCDGMLLKRSRKMHFWNLRWCSLDPELGVLEWRKSQEDAAPNGYVDMTAAKVVDIGDNEDGMVVDGKTHCFLVIDSGGVEHIFCAETTRAFALWLPELTRYLRVGAQPSVAHGSDDAPTNSDSAAAEALEKSSEAPAAVTARVDVVTDTDVELRGSQQSSLQPSPSTVAGASTREEVATVPVMTNTTNASEVGTSGASKAHDRLILRVCVGGIRRLNSEIFPMNGSSRRIYFELRTGSFSRTTKTVHVSNHHHPAPADNAWNETLSLASCAKVSAPLVLTAFEDRCRGALKSLSTKAPPRLLGSAVISWSHYAQEEVVSFHVVLRGASEHALGEVRLNLQILSPYPPPESSGAHHHHHSQQRGAQSPSSPSATVLTAPRPTTRAKILDNNSKRRASEISLATMNSYGHGREYYLRGRQYSDDDVDMREGYEYDMNENGHRGGGVRGALQALFAPCFGSRSENNNTKYQLIERT